MIYKIFRKNHISSVEEKLYEIIHSYLFKKFNLLVKLMTLKQFLQLKEEKKNLIINQEIKHKFQ